MWHGTHRQPKGEISMDSQKGMFVRNNTADIVTIPITNMTMKVSGHAIIIIMGPEKASLYYNDKL